MFNSKFQFLLQVSLHITTDIAKKPEQNSGFLILSKGYQSKLSLFFFEVNCFKSNVTPKLTTAPIKAKTIVFKTSAEVKLGITLNANPPKVPAFKVKELSIPSNVSFGLCLIFFVGFIVYRNLAYC